MIAIIVFLVLGLLLFLVTGAIVLLLLADRWLVATINGLDRFMTRIGFGKWSAGALTKAEEWVRERKEKKGE